MRRIISLYLLTLIASFAGCSLDKESGNAMKDHEAEKEKQLAEAKPAPSPRINPQTHLAAGQMLEKQGDLKGALGQYEQAVAANPKLAIGYNRLGIVYEKLGRFKDAEQVFRIGIDADATSASLRNNLGYCFLAQRRFDEAQEQFTAALALMPNFKRARMNLGIAFAQTGRLDKGLAEFKKVISEDAANYNLAVICLTSGDYPSAEKFLKQALALNPKLNGAQEKLDQLTAMARSGQIPGPPPVIANTANARKGVPLSTPGVPLAGTADDENVTAPK